MRLNKKGLEIEESLSLLIMILKVKHIEVEGTEERGFACGFVNLKIFLVMYVA